MSLRLPKKILISGVLLFAIVFGALFTNYTLKDHTLDKSVSGIDLIWQRLESGFVLKYNKDRLLLWESGVAAIKDHPITGIGMKNDAQVMLPYREALTKQHQHEFFNSAGAGVHNIYLQLVVHSGFVGLIGYLALVLFVFVYQIRNLRKAGSQFDFYHSIIWGVTASLGGFLVAGLFENNFYDAEVQTALVMMLGLSAYAGRKLQQS